ncbi:MAG: YitT family protein [Bacteroidales bacterium]|nr:YitT family protein [Bacteroidales bacterium]
MEQTQNKVKAWFGQLVDPNEKIFSKQWFKSYALIVFGTLLFVIADVIFAMPYHLAPGGVYGLANVLTALTGTPLTIFLISMEVPLLVIGSIILGPKFGIKTIVSIVLGWVFTHFIETYWGYEPLIHVGEFFTSVQNLPFDAMQITNEARYFIPDYLLNTLIAGLLYGVGIGMIFKSGATSGGSDIVSMIINKYSGISLGTLVIIVDSCIALSTLFITPDLRLPAYSVLLIFIEGKIIDVVIDGFKSYKTVMIVSDNTEAVKTAITNDLKRGSSCFEAKGMYKGVERSMIYITISKREYVQLKKAILDIDPNAFVNVVDSSEVMGEGFKPISA